MTVVNSVKLANPFVPSAYALRVKVDIDKWTYETHETITLLRNEQYPLGNTIQLHGASTIEVVSISGATIVKRDSHAQTLHLKLDDEHLTDDSHPQIHIHFSHCIQEELRGFYRVHFTHDGKEHRMASTHFEPVSARLFYICQDEPAQRADFSITVVLPVAHQHYTVLSNGPLKSKEVHTDKDEVVYEFADVPKCPPYLTACVVGELESISKTVNGIPVSVYATPGKIDRANFALETTAFALEYFERFFQCKYPLPKLDVVAVPDFPIGGMENWGCIACVESILIGENSGISAKKRASELICHEVSHNWFGNLVAINWWEGLWLKEGFASWCGNHASHIREPTWRCLDDAAQSVSAAMETDMHEHSHPVEVPINDPSDITQIFDSISYDKGMGLVMMLEAFLGPEKWGPAVAHYINKYRFKDTKTVQLWEALEESSGLPIAEMMKGFTTQMGYPMVHVTRTGPNTVTLRQQPCRFVTSSAKSSQSWCIPLVLSNEDTKDNGGHMTFTLRGSDEQTVELPDSMAASQWLTANRGRTGFYRCRYDDETFTQLLKRYPQLSVGDRRALISDTTCAVLMGYDDLLRVARLSERVSKYEKDSSVIREHVRGIDNVVAGIETAELRNLCRAKQLNYFLKRSKLDVSKVPNTNEEKMYHSVIINGALSLFLHNIPTRYSLCKPVYAWGVANAGQFMEDKPYDCDTLACSLGLYSAVDTIMEQDSKYKLLCDKLKKEEGNDEASRAIIYGLCMLRKTHYATWAMKSCIDSNEVRSQFGTNVFAALAANHEFKEGEVWALFKKNFDSINKQWGGGQFRIQTIVSLVGSTLHGEAAAKEFEEFFKSNPLPNSRLAIGRAAEGMRLREWLNGKWSSSAMDTLFKKTWNPNKIRRK